MKFWLLYSGASLLIFSLLIGLPYRMGVGRSYLPMTGMVLMLLAPFVAQAIHAKLTFAPDGAETIAFSGSLFWNYVLISFISSYLLFGVMAGADFLIFKMMDAVGEMGMVLMFNILAPPFTVIGFAAIFFAAERFHLSPTKFFGWNILGWIVASPVIALLSWFVLLAAFQLFRSLLNKIG